jgi:hypothetical protein
MFFFKNIWTHSIPQMFQNEFHFHAVGSINPVLLGQVDTAYLIIWLAAL